MKRALMAVVVATIVSSSTGCCLIDRIFHCRGRCGPPMSCGPGFCADGHGGCADCRYHCNDGYGDGKDCGLLARRKAARNAGPDYASMGPVGAQVAYPYYTNRGPRDFFAENPPSLGH